MAEIQVGIDLLATDNASKNIESVSDSLDSLNKQTSDKLNSELKKSGIEVEKLGGKFKRFKDVSMNSMNTAVNSGAITGELGKITPAIGGASAAFGSLLQTGFNPLSIAITGVAVALPFLVGALTSTKPSVESLTSSFADLKKSINDANDQIFQADAQLRNIRNTGLDVYLSGITQYYKDIETANKQVKKNAEKNSIEIANSYIMAFSKMRAQGAEAYEALKIPKETQNVFDDFGKKINAISANFAGELEPDIQKSNEALKAYGGTIKATFQGEEILSYFQKAQKAGKDFDSAFMEISNKLLNINKDNIESFLDMTTAQGKFYAELKKQSQDAYNAFKINTDKQKQEEAKIAIERAQKLKADNQKYIETMINYNKERLDNTLNFENELTGQIISSQMSLFERTKKIKDEEIEKMAISQDEIKEMQTAFYLDQLKMEQEFLKKYTEGMAAFGGAMEKKSPIENVADGWEKFVNNFSTEKMRDELDKFMASQNMFTNIVNIGLGSVEKSAQAVAGGFRKMGAGAKFSLGELGNALKQSVAKELEALSAKALVWGIYEVAQGIAAAASYRYSEAGQHFAAAAKFGAVAVAAGVGAGVIGGSGGTGSASGGGGQVGGNAPEVQRQVAQTINIYGDVDKTNLDKIEKTQNALSYQLSQSMAVA